MKSLFLFFLVFFFCFDIFSLSLSLCVCVCVHTCVFIECKKQKQQLTYFSVICCIYMYICVCVCVCMYVCTFIVCFKTQNIKNSVSVYHHLEVLTHHIQDDCSVPLRVQHDGLGCSLLIKSIKFSR